MKSLVIKIMFGICFITYLTACSNATKTSATIKSPSNAKNKPVGSITQTWTW